MSTSNRRRTRSVTAAAAAREEAAREEARTRADVPAGVLAPRDRRRRRDDHLGGSRVPRENIETLMAVHRHFQDSNVMLSLDELHVLLRRVGFSKGRCIYHVNKVMQKVDDELLRRAAADETFFLRVSLEADELDVSSTEPIVVEDSDDDESETEVDTSETEVDEEKRDHYEYA